MPSTGSDARVGAACGLVFVPMTLESGQRLGAYRIDGELGRGGMGEVYRARDCTLERDVAIKVLPRDLADDRERRARFEREARLLASLNHPNVATVHGFETAPVDGREVLFLVMELVEGADLATRLQRGPLQLHDALDIGRQICTGLEAAHASGVVHRDLKPANLKLTADGRLKILDFGLAKTTPDDLERADVTQSPTLTIGETRAGVLMGTAAYMSPEQASGAEVDQRSDIWAFGVVLYEMLVGRSPFEDKSAAHTLAAVLRSEPEWQALPASVPVSIRRLLRRCLAKEPRDRLQAIGDARLEIEEGMAEGDEAETAGAATSKIRLNRSSWLGWVLALVFAGVAAVGLLGRRDSPPPAVTKLHIEVTHDLLFPQIAPNGRRVAFSREGSLWVRDFDRLEERRIEGTEGSNQRFFWSYDSQRLAFARGGDLWTVDLESGSSSILCAIPQTGTFFDGGSWGSRGTIVISPGGDLHVVHEAGGDSRLLLEHQGPPVMFPSWLPDERGIVFTELGGSSIELLVDGEVRTLLSLPGSALEHPVYSRSGHILYLRAQTSPGLYALPFSLESLEATGEPILVTSVGGTPSVSRDDTLLYRPEVGATLSLRPFQLLWVGRDGTIAARIGEPKPGIRDPAISPSGNQVAVSALDGASRDIWLFGVDRSSLTRVTPSTWLADPQEQISYEWAPAWISEDELLFSTRQWILRADSEGSRDPERLAQGRWPAMSPDGRYAVFTSNDGNSDLHYLDLHQGGEARALVQTPQALELFPAISPDGRYVAYQSNESGRYEIYLKRFPSGDGRWPVSTNGGFGIRWNPLGGELFFWERGRLMSVAVELDGEPLLSEPRELFSVGSDVELNGRQYDVAADGQHFVMVDVAEPDADDFAGPTPLVVVQNWSADLP